MRLYTKEHLWLDFEDGIVVLGLTSYAISQLGEITFLTQYITKRRNFQGQTTQKSLIIKRLTHYAEHIINNHYERKSWLTVFVNILPPADLGSH
ncbi:glycine cleavage system H protein [Victivallis vadensis]|uniref:Glycine cleavage system H protein n=1 Tax=Victivallis vadensis TaxID=172901 RepID=A0A2U1ASP6_9BACT|nr:glycine cleavage system H protein [Victivallis vadensis]